jgi:hypothetical protein
MRVRFLLCFGCHEIKIALPETTWRFDLTDATRDKLKHLLFPHHSNLPDESRYPH